MSLIIINEPIKDTEYVNKVKVINNRYHQETSSVGYLHSDIYLSYSKLSEMLRKWSLKYELVCINVQDRTNMQKHEKNNVFPCSVPPF